MSQARELKKQGYKIQVGYSDEAKEKRLIKFVLDPRKKEFEISADELISILVSQVNSDTLAPVFVDSERVVVVNVGRQLQCVLDRDMKKGQKINLNYSHPYPIEFALIEEGYKIAQIKKDAPAISLSKEYIDDVIKRTKPESKEFVEKFYKSFRNVKLGK